MASTLESAKNMATRRTASNDSLGSHLAFYGSAPQLQISTPPFRPPPTAEELDQLYQLNQLSQVQSFDKRDSSYIEPFVLLLS
jgi:hypothetical protein